MKNVWLLFAALALLGCVTQTQYVCPDQRVVDDPSLCFPKSNGTPTPTPNGPEILPAPTLPANGKPEIQPPSSEALEKLEKDILEEINVVRAVEAMKALQWNERAASAARKYAQELVEQERFAHTGSEGSNIHDRLRAEGLFEFVANENLAQLSFDGTVPESSKVVNGWLKSPGHRSNILDVDGLYSHAGVGAYCAKEVCVFAYTAVGLRRSNAYTLGKNFYSFVYLNDPGYGFGETVAMRVTLSNATGSLDAYVLPDSKAFEQAKQLPADAFERRAFPYIQAFEARNAFSATLNASVGMGLMVINTASGENQFQLDVELVDD
ncbi:CAP domain-containing protein [Candidatus Micrarchaeota archaeon]|nr:CAP domain-containing protein [Candidatus Micrarchaeota archaeon]